MARFRTNKLKHEHTIVEGIRPVLERIAACPDVHAVIPGAIHAAGAARGLSVTVQYETDTGLRLLARTGSAVQEVFLVSHDPAAARRWLEDRGLVRAAPPPPPVTAPPPASQVLLPHTAACARCGRPIAAGSRGYRTGKAPHVRYFHVRCYRTGSPS